MATIKSIIVLSVLSIASGLAPTNSGPGRIAFYMGFVSKSSRITYVPLVEALARRGHHVTLIDCWDYKDPPDNVSHIRVDSLLQKSLVEYSDTLLGKKPTRPWHILDHFQGFIEVALKSGRNAISHPQVRQLIESGAKYDVFISSVFYTNEFGYFLASKFNATLGLYSTIQCSSLAMSSGLAEPSNPAYMNTGCMGFTYPDTFKKRLINLMFSSMRLIRDYYILPLIEDVIQQQYNESVRLLDIESKSTAFAMGFTHPLLMDGLRPVAPNYVHLGMMNCRQAMALPDDLAKFLDGADENGVIYVSFGTVIVPHKVDVKHEQRLVSVFQKLKQRVLWKWERPVSDPKIMTAPWLPQQDVLAHPKVKLFISHGGQSSCQESLCHGKPMLVLSVFGDQWANGEEMKRLGLALHIPFTEASEEDLLQSIQTILNEQTFAQKAKKMGELLLDEMNPPLSKAIWWIEYAIRNPGMQHFRSPVHDMSWIQLYNIDVIIVVVLVVLGLLAVSMCGFKLMTKLCFRKKQKRE